MIRHLLKLVWNMKRTHALVIVEIFFSFLVLAAVLTATLFFIDNYRRPLGYDYQNVWTVEIDMKRPSDDSWTPEMTGRFANLLREITAMPEVEAAAGVQYPPYSAGNTVWATEKIPALNFDEATDDLPAVLHLDLIAGRWFRASDDAVDWVPVVIDQDAARAVFGSKDPIGQRIDLSSDRDPGAAPPPDFRVVGLLSDFRKGGEFSTRTNFVFRRVNVGDPKSRPPREIAIRVAPGTPASFEEPLIRRLQPLAPDWSFQVSTLVKRRDLALRLELAPLIIAGVIAGSLILMVALGLTGVVWQNVTRRTRELGLRRALGASGRSVHLQILAEVMIVSSIGLILGLAVGVQFPLMGALGFLEEGVFAAALALAAVLILLLSAACALYPAWLASRVQPAEALHYE